MLCVTAQAVTRSQSGTPQRPAVDITNADIRATIKTAPTDAVTDQQIRVVDIGTYKRRGRRAASRGESETNGHLSRAGDRVYHIIDGAGTFVTGGEMVDPTPVTLRRQHGEGTGRSESGGTSIRGGQSRRVGPGDVIVIPPGVAHWFSARRERHELSRGSHRCPTRTARRLRQPRDHS